jgi:repressor LexA
MLENRPSKKQQELFEYISGFIKGNGYGPSYREIMRALDYKSVSTVAVHVDGLIACGKLRKKDNSARSLEVVVEGPEQPANIEHIAWLEREIKKHQEKDTEKAKHEVIVLQNALKILNPNGEPKTTPQPKSQK